MLDSIHSIVHFTQNSFHKYHYDNESKCDSVLPGGTSIIDQISQTIIFFKLMLLLVMIKKNSITKTSINIQRCHQHYNSHVSTLNAIKSRI